MTGRDLSQKSSINFVCVFTIVAEHETDLVERSIGIDYVFSECHKRAA